MKKTLDAAGVGAFCESMGMMLGAGIQVDEALALLSENDAPEAEKGPLGTALRLMRPLVEEGMPLSGAMEEAMIFPAYAVSMAAAGEKAGRLEEVCRHLADYYAAQKAMNDKLKSAVTYPVIMLVLIILVLMAMLTMILPAFRDVYDTLTGSLTASSYRYVNLASGICLAVLAVMLLLAAAFLVCRLLRHGKGRRRVAAFLSLIPAVGRVFESLALFRFVSALELFLAGGAMQDEAFRDAEAFVDYPALETKLEKCRSLMDEGHSLSRAVYETSLFEPVYGRMLLAGERSGSLTEVLDRLKTLLADNTASQVDQVTGVVDPLLSGVIILTIGLSLLSVMLPLIGIMNAIG